VLEVDDGLKPALAWSAVINEYYYISGTVMIAIGVFLGFWGNAFFNLAMGIYTAMFIFVVVMTCASWWTWLETAVGWVICTIVALLLAFVCAKSVIKSKTEHKGMWIINMGTSFYCSCITYDIILFTVGFESFALLLSLTFGYAIVMAYFTY
jgi:hypothetical protein